MIKKYGIVYFEGEKKARVLKIVSMHMFLSDLCLVGGVSNDLFTKWRRQDKAR